MESIQKRRREYWIVSTQVRNDKESIYLCQKKSELKMPHKEVSWRTLIAYALPGLPLAALTLPLYVIIPTVYTETLGLSLATVGAILLVVRIIDGILDPIIGWYADRWKGPYGRRKTWFALSLPLTTFAAIMIFTPSEDSGAGYLLLWSVALSIGYTATYLSFSSWGAELSTTYNGRDRISAMREGVIILGTLVATAMPALQNIISMERQDEGLLLLALFIGIGLPLFGAITLWQVPEPEDRSTKAILPLREGLKAMRENKPFLRLIIAFLINGIANGLPATLFLYFVSEKLQAPEMRGPILFSYFLAGMIAIPLWAWVSTKIGKHKSWCFAMIVACIAFVFAPFMGPDDLTVFFIIAIITGSCVGADLFLPASIQADVVDEDTASSGSQRTGFYFAAWALVTKMALALAAGLAFPVLELTGFDPEAAQQSEISLWTLGILYAWIPVAFKLVAIWLMWSFPLDAEKLKNLSSKISR
jgi:GPH family glycoside/pentoside/hexuronide:cation symporter